MKVLVAIAVLCAASSARADVDNARADQLFREGVALRKVNPQEACARFAQALVFNPQSITTRLNLALCDEELGRIATAVERWQDIADRARDQKLDEYEQMAVQHLGALTPEVPYLSFAFQQAVAGITVLVDQQVVPLEKLEKVAVDPGDREVIVTAPGRVAYKRTVRIGRKMTLKVDVPPLAKSVVRWEPPSRRTVGKFLVAGGSVTIASAVLVGLVARSRRNSAVRDECDDDICSPEGVERVDSARSIGTIGTALAITGVIATGAGALLWRYSPARREPPVAFGPLVHEGGGGLAAFGRF